MKPCTTHSPSLWRTISPCKEPFKHEMAALFCWNCCIHCIVFYLVSLSFCSSAWKHSGEYVIPECTALDSVQEMHPSKTWNTHNALRRERKSETLARLCVLLRSQREAHYSLCISFAVYPERHSLCCTLLSQLQYFNISRLKNVPEYLAKFSQLTFTHMHRYLCSLKLKIYTSKQTWNVFFRAVFSWAFVKDLSKH